MGLGDPLRVDVELQCPNNLEVAMSLARAYELRQQCATFAPRTMSCPATFRTPAATGSTNATPGSTGATPGPTDAPPQQVTSRGGCFTRRLTVPEMEERKRLVLCYNCDDKFSRFHTCKNLFLWEIDYAVGADEAIEDSEPQISLLTISGVHTSKTMQIELRLGNASFIILLNSGSTDNFVSTEAADRADVSFAPRADLRVAVANGKRVAYAGVCHNAMITIADESFFIDLHTIPLGGYDIVLDTQWLATLSPILWDFGLLTVAF